MHLETPQQIKGLPMFSGARLRLTTSFSFVKGREPLKPSHSTTPAQNSQGQFGSYSLIHSLQSFLTYSRVMDCIQNLRCGMLQRIARYCWPYSQGHIIILMRHPPPILT